MNTVKSSNSPSKREGWYRAFQNLVTEYSFESLRVEGMIPQDLAGTLYRVGPGQFDAFGKKLPHWFDGDGAIAAIRILDGKASGAAKMIQTKGAQKEKKAGELFLSSYGISAKSWFNRLTMAFRNAANTSLFVWNNQLFALWEAGLPTEISTHDLSTLGETRLHGTLNRTFSAHPHFVPSRNAHYNFGIHYGPNPKIELFELREDGHAKTLGSVPFPGTAFVHDFIATDHYLVFIAAPIFVDAMGLLFKGIPTSNAMHWQEKAGTHLIIVPIDNPKAHWKLHSHAFLDVHFFNGFERGDELVIDGISYSDMSTIDGLKSYTEGKTPTATPGAVTRKVIHLKEKTLRFEKIVDLFCEFPQVSPEVFARDYSWGYVLSQKTQAGPDYFTAISKINMKTKQYQTIDFGHGYYPSEPLFVSKKGGIAEDDGYILTLVYDSVLHQSYVVVLDAKAFSSEPLAKIYLTDFFPLTFHGCWAPRTKVE